MLISPDVDGPADWNSWHNFLESMNPGCPKDIYGMVVSLATSP